jgi:arylsulfatase A-like enzyme
MATAHPSSNRRPGIWTALAVAIILAGCARSEPAVEALLARNSILLITVDTLRADRLSSYGYARQTSPTIDRLAAEGVRFDQAIVQWPKTGPSFASIFTGTYPRHHRLIPEVGMPVPSSYRMLAEVLQAQGYSTHAVVANAALATEFSFNQGFTSYVESWKHEPTGANPDATGASHVTDLALATAGQLRPDEPFFLWVHYLDPHFPYSPPGAWSDLFQDDEWFDPSQRIPIDPDHPNRRTGGIGSRFVLDNRDDLAFYSARYDAEIVYTDAQIQILLQEMTELGLLRDTLTVLTSDHGEALGERLYYFDHGRFAYETALRVPLIFHFPGVLSPRVDRDPAEVLHLAPTLLQVAGVPLENDSWMQGHSLIPRLLGSSERPTGSTLAYAQAEVQRVVRNRRFKLIRGPGGPRLFDLERDPGESVDVGEEYPEVKRRLRAALDRWEKAEHVDLAVDTNGQDEPTEIEAETEQQLRALGYIE